MEHFGFWSIIPTISVLIIALFTRKTFEALLGGTIIGYIIVEQTNFFTGFTTSLLSVMQDATIGWIILVCGLFGSLIQLVVHSGGAMAFANYLSKYIKNRKQALVTTWLLGLLIFIDDYLNALTIGSTMKKITDKFNVSREMLAYIVDSTAAPICVLIPLSTWAIYLSGLLESNQIAATGEGLQTYISIIPYMTYGWVAAIIVPLVTLGIVPKFGAMKKAEQRAASGQVVPPNSDAIALKMNAEEESTHAKFSYFLLPIIVLIGATIFFEIDALKGVMTSIVFTATYFIVAKVMDFKQTMQCAFDGFKTMIYALSIIVMSFVLKNVNDQLGLTQFIIETVSPLMDKALLPAIAFVALSFVTFSTGSFWGVYAISFPIIIPLAQSLDMHMGLAIGSVISAGAFGSHACFYGDATVLSSSATGCNNMAHVVTQFPYALLAGVISVIIYLVLGFSM